MCGVIDDIGGFIKDSIGEITSHPWQALGAAAGVPGYDPFFGGLFNNGPNGAIISPTGNFTPGAWQDMYQANPGDSGALGLFSGINSIADKVAPAIAAPGISNGLGAAFGALSGGAGEAASTGADAFTTGLETTAPATLGGLESGLGGAGTFGLNAGTGTAIDSGLAQGLGAGGLGVAGPSTLTGITSGAAGAAGALGGGTAGTGLAGQGSIVPPQGPASPVDVGNGAASLEGSQTAAIPGGAPGGQANLAALYGPNSTAAGSQIGQGINASAEGSQAGPQFGALGEGTTGAPGMAGATDIPGQSIGNGYSQAANSAAQGGGGVNDFLTSLFGNQAGVGGAGAGNGEYNALTSLLKAGLGAFQQNSQQGRYNNYVNQINDLYSPNSPYAQQMAQTLARQDAAAGRNSQYGTRATQLAAALTNDRARALTSAPYSQASFANPGANILNSLFSNFTGPQGIQNAQGLYNLGSSAFGGLSSLFGG